LKGVLHLDPVARYPHRVDIVLGFLSRRVQTPTHITAGEMMLAYASGWYSFIRAVSKE